jgi:hypothetical protein
MDMKNHILSALREQYHQWEEFLADLDVEQITSPNFDDDWSIKDVISHLWVWQQISIARMNAVILDCLPGFPDWLAEFPGNWDEDADQTNAWMYTMLHHRSWAETHQDWREGFLQLLELGQLIPERDLLDGARYSWLNGYSPAFVLMASYEHHQEHLEKLNAWLLDHK